MAMIHRILLNPFAKKPFSVPAMRAEYRTVRRAVQDVFMRTGRSVPVNLPATRKAFRHVTGVPLLTVFDSPLLKRFGMSGWALPRYGGAACDRIGYSRMSLITFNPKEVYHYYVWHEISHAAQNLHPLTRDGLLDGSATAYHAITETWGHWLKQKHAWLFPPKKRNRPDPPSRKKLLQVIRRELKVLSPQERYDLRKAFLNEVQAYRYGANYSGKSWFGEEMARESAVLYGLVSREAKKLGPCGRPGV